MKNTPFVFVLSDSQSLVHNHVNLSKHPLLVNFTFTVVRNKHIKILLPKDQIVTWLVSSYV